ncbi:MAG: cytochrome c3 family protein [bacterium]
MKKTLIVALLAISLMVVGISTLRAADLTKAPEEVEINSKYEKDSKPPLKFSHKKHASAKCDECHHDYEDGKNLWKEGDAVKKCSACHTTENKKVLKEAFHDNCWKGCHKTNKDAIAKNAPTKCNDCHVKTK